MNKLNEVCYIIEQRRRKRNYKKRLKIRQNDETKLPDKSGA